MLRRCEPELLADDDDLENLVHLVRTYFRLDGHHIQFNVVDAESLREAQENPEQHRDLIVRVAGYSDYFCDLGRTRRTRSSPGQSTSRSERGCSHDGRNPAV